MAIVVETGLGVADAVSYASAATITAYWTLRPNRVESASWLAAAENIQEGAAIEGTAFLDATYGAYYKGVQQGYIQGLLYPRVGAKDEAGRLLPALPAVLVNATCELAGRAVTAALSADQDIAGNVVKTSVSVAGIKESFEYGGVATMEKKFGFVAAMLDPILNGSQPGAPSGNWSWN